MNDDISIELIREAFIYQNYFSAKTIVFKIDFPVTETAGFPYLMKDIALLAKLGVRVALVPSSGEYISRLLADQGIMASFLDSGERLTTAQAMPYVEMAAFHTATRCMTALSASRADALIGNFVRARGLGVVNGVDCECTGAVDRIFFNALLRVLDARMIPILPCIGWSPAGRAYNISSDGIALAVCAALGAVKLVIVTAESYFDGEAASVVPDAPQNESGKILRLSPLQARALLGFYDGGAGSQNASRKNNAACALRLSLAALDAGVERAHIVDAREEGVILRELFSNMGAGTMITAGEYEAIRSINNADIPDILRLMEPLMRAGVLLRRRAEDIQQKKEDYAVFAVDGVIHACAALHDWGEQQAEIAALAADPAYARTGAGSNLVRYLIEKARRGGFKRVFALTTTTQDWFEQLGFAETAIESLPAQKREKYDRKRASKAFALDL